jgi:hypothetical protein
MSDGNSMSNFECRKKPLLMNLVLLLLLVMLPGCGAEWFPAPPNSVGITTTTLPNAPLNAAYSQTLAAFGGKSPYTWAVASGSTLPAGLTLSSAGVLSGTPTTAGSTTFSVTVTDSSSPATTATQSLSLTVTGAATVTLLPGQSVTITAGQTVIVPSGTTITPPNGTAAVINGNTTAATGSVLNAPATANTAITFTVTGV